MLEVAFGEQVVGRTYIFEWLFKFRSCVAFVKDVDCVSYSSKSKKGDSVNQKQEYFYS